MKPDLNRRTLPLLDRLSDALDEFRIRELRVEEARVFDLGVDCEGGLDAGQALAEICMAGLGWASVIPGHIGGAAWPQVFVSTDHPVSACLLSQYAGWQISVGKFFAMGSGPMRAAYAGEDLFRDLEYREEAEDVVGVLETRKLPNEQVVQYLCERIGITSDKLTLLVAPTASQAGNLQVVARSVETALHKLHELGYNVRRIRSACGNTPLPPVARDDMAGIGRTNDAILYGGRVTLWVRDDDDAIAAIGPKVPAQSSSAFGRPFMELFEEAGRDFYKIDPHLFSPAEVTFCNLDTGRTQRFGATRDDIVQSSFGIV